MRADQRPLRSTDYHTPPQHIEDGRARFDKLVPRPPEVLDRCDQPIPNNHCWNFTGPRHDSGYGRFYTGSRGYYAHRFAYELWVGLVPESYRVAHTCTANLLCCRPAHLELRQAPGRPSKLKPSDLDDLKYFFRTEFDCPKPSYTPAWAAVQYGISERYARQLRDEAILQVRNDPFYAERVAAFDARRRSALILRND